MRNLKIVRRTGWEPQNAVPVVTAFDNTNDAVICCYGPSEGSNTVELKRLTRERKDEGTAVASWDAPCPLPSLPFDRVVSLHYLADTATICLVFAGGDLVLVREDPLPNEEKIEIVGSVDAGVAAAAWSADEELLVICTNVESLLYMTRDLEAVTTIQFNEDDLKISKHVSVGWGKAETQFKGKGAKGLRDPTIPEKFDEGLSSNCDHGEVSISWRGDGAFVAVNSRSDKLRRVIRVFSRDGNLDSVSEPVDGLEGALSWRPAGNLIAGVQRLQDRIDVVFFERNGLRHGQFGLRLTPDEMETWAKHVCLSWNYDSTVLAVSFCDRVQLWTMGNYHWYLKQEILASSENDAEMQNVGVAWNYEEALQLAVTTSRLLQRIDCIFDVCSDSPHPPNDIGTVAVVDGKLLKLTPLGMTNVPPPMSLHEILVKSSITDVAVNQDRLAILRFGEIDEYAYHGSEPVFVGTYAVKRGHQVCFHDEAILVLGNDGISAINAKFGDIAFTVSLDPCRLFTTMDGTAALTYWNGVVSRCNAQGALESISKSPVALPWVGSDGINVYGRATSGTLYANGRVLLHNCTSFIVTRTHLIISTSHHLLKFIHLTNGELEIPPDEPEKDERCRSIERGARAIVVLPSSHAVVLQMPRGNLETIYPRALVLAGIRKSVAEKEYKSAFLACRKHRVDLNILYDYAPEQFLANVALFVSQVRKVEYIDLFLSQLREENVSQTMYKETLTADSASEPSPMQLLATKMNGAVSKVNRICDALLSVLQSRTKSNLQNTITANVCKSPPDLKAGLKIVTNLRQQSVELAERATEHICFLVDVNQLYDEALGLYDLELATMIAQSSQKDPREYLPYLQNLQEMAPFRRKFAIDDHLGRYETALQHLRALRDFEAFKAYVQKHELYSIGLDLYRYEPDSLKVLIRLHADYLSIRSKFREAALGE